MNFIKIPYLKVNDFVVCITRDHKVYGPEDKPPFVLPYYIATIDADNDCILGYHWVPTLRPEIESTINNVIQLSSVYENEFSVDYSFIDYTPDNNYIECASFVIDTGTALNEFEKLSKEEFNYFPFYEILDEFNKGLTHELAILLPVYASLDYISQPESRHLEKNPPRCGGY